MKRLAEKPKQQNKTVAKEASEPSENSDVDDILKSIEDAFSGIADAFGEIVKIINKIPKVGFILPDGSYLNVKDYGVTTHEDLAGILLKKKFESDYHALIAIMKKGYVRFKVEDRQAIVLTETYLTGSQFYTVRDAIDSLGKGVVEISKDGRLRGYMRLERDTLDRDMLALEAMLNREGLPNPKS